MKRSSIAALVLLVFGRPAFHESALADPYAPNPDEVSGAVEASNRFALALFQAISDDSGNLLFSPLGISNILGVVYSGARGDTRDEMASIFHSSDRREETHDYDVYSPLLCRIQKRAQGNDCRLLLDCRLLVPARCRFHDAYLARIQERHGTAFSLFSSPGDPHAAVALHSGNAQDAGEPFADLLSGHAGGAFLFLTGAVDLRGGWALPFDAGETRRAPFYALERVSPRETRERPVTVPMMRRTGAYGYARRGGVQVLEIPYSEPTLSLIILLPDDYGELLRLQEEMGSGSLERWLDGLEKRELQVTIPRLRLAGETDLRRALPRMGIRSPFYENTADFSGVSGERLCLGRLGHSCRLTVEEDGGAPSDAEPARLLRFGPSPDGPPEFRVDRPFLLLVRDAESGGILVLGRVMDPAL